MVSSSIFFLFPLWHVEIGKMLQFLDPSEPIQDLGNPQISLPDPPSLVPFLKPDVIIFSICDSDRELYFLIY